MSLPGTVPKDSTTNNALAATDIYFYFGQSVGYGNPGGAFGNAYTPAVEGVMQVLSHEICEYMTDPDGQSGWLAVGGNCNGTGQCEIADLCTPGKYVSVFATGHYSNGAIGQAEYSNKDGGCIAPGSNDWNKSKSPTSILKKAVGGSPVKSHPKVIFIFWGSQWNTQTGPSKNDIIDNFQKLLQTPFFSVLQQYNNLQPPTYWFSTTFTGSPTPHDKYVNADVTNVVKACFSNGSVPTPDWKGAGTEDTIFYFVFAPKPYINSECGCGGWHWLQPIAKGSNKWVAPTPPPPPPPPPGPPGPPGPPPPPGGPSGGDRFGVRKFYMTRDCSTEYFIEVRNNLSADTRVAMLGSSTGPDPNATHITVNNDTSQVPPRVEIKIFPDTNHANGTADHSLANTRGYMRASNDYRSVEITEYHHINNITDQTERLTHIVRSGHHISTNSGCTGTGYEPAITWAGMAQFQKEFYHPSGIWKISNTDPIFSKFGKPLGKSPGSIVGKWIGQKTIVYDMDNGHVGVDVYYDGPYDSEPAKAANNWILFYHLEDDSAGSMGSLGLAACNPTSSTEIFRFGGPEITIRANSLPTSGMDMKWVSVREIDIKAPVVLPSGPPPPPPGPPPPVAKNLRSTVRLVWNVNYATVDLCFGGF